jgi:hypothetical protein
MRVNIKAILADPAKRRAMMVPAIIAIQAREGIVTTLAQAEAAYDAVVGEQGRDGQRACATAGGCSNRVNKPSGSGV